MWFKPEPAGFLDSHHHLIEIQRLPENFVDHAGAAHHLLRPFRVDTGEDELPSPHDRRITQHLQVVPAALVWGNEIVDDDGGVMLPHEVQQIQAAALDLVHVGANSHKTCVIEQLPEHLDDIVVAVQDGDDYPRV